MGGCGSTELIAWVAQHIECNCPMNSEGLPKPGPGSNWKGLKHRMRPPAVDDQYLPHGKSIDRGLFLFDSPYRIIPSLFRRKIAVGHAIAITGARPRHENDLDRFLEDGVDSFGFLEQFSSWCGMSDRPGYPCMLLKASSIWSHTSELLAFLGVPTRAAVSFPAERQRQSSFAQLSDFQKEKMRSIYAALNERVTSTHDIQVI